MKRIMQKLALIGFTLFFTLMPENSLAANRLMQICRINDGIFNTLLDEDGKDEAAICEFSLEEEPDVKIDSMSLIGYSSENFSTLAVSHFMAGVTDCEASGGVVLNANIGQVCRYTEVTPQDKKHPYSVIDIETLKSELDSPRRVFLQNKLANLIH